MRVLFWPYISVKPRSSFSPSGDCPRLNPSACSVLFDCGACLRRLVELEVKLATQELIEGDRAPVLNKRKPLFIVHDTGDGLIFSRTERRGRKWTARHWGDQLNGERECATMREANEFLIQSFAEMFPEHRCTERCRIEPPDIAEP